ncbi:MAG TPA: hypothetical protein VG603_07150 [Chitinophagales bacterium]|nr:hypothetical protein [Chitinophagales bacterium]
MSNDNDNNNRKVVKIINRNTGSGFYFLGFLGAAIYYIQHAVGFWPGVVGFLKACVWPVFLVYQAMGFLKL